MRITPTLGRHGSAAMEFVLIAPIMLSLLFALLDMGTAAMQFIYCYETMSGVAAYAASHPPSDVTNPGTWLSTQLPSGMSVTVLCNWATCTNASVTPRSFQLSQQVTVSAVLLTFLAGTYPVNYYGPLP